MSELSDFVEHARGKGMDHATIRMLLLSAGWKEKDIVEVLARTSLDRPIPAPPDRGGAREAFLHLLSFAAFYASAIATVVLLFLYVDRLFPDAALDEGRSELQLSGIRWSMAYAIVAFPLYLLLSRALLREMRLHPEKAWSATRRWLTYLTLLLSALALAGDVIALVFRLLEGELTSRFVLKVAIVLLLAGLALVYHLLALRMPAGRRETARMHRGFALAASAIVALTLVWGFAAAGSPGATRLRKFDARRLDDLQTIRGEIEALCLGDERQQPPGERRLLRPLPATLAELAELAQYQRPDVRDPESGEPYGYEVLDETRFALCATFHFARDDERAPVWNHAPGRQCFEFDALRP